MVEETRVLLGLWKPGMSATSLKVMAVESGEFPGMSARRVRNLVVECFAPRFLAENGRLALFLKSVTDSVVAACRANAIHCRRSSIWRSWTDWHSTYRAGKC